jgi:hypothetical protein
MVVGEHTPRCLGARRNPASPRQRHVGAFTAIASGSGIAYSRQLLRVRARRALRATSASTSSSSYQVQDLCSGPALQVDFLDSRLQRDSAAQASPGEPGTTARHSHRKALQLLCDLSWNGERSGQPPTRRVRMRPADRTISRPSCAAGRSSAIPGVGSSIRQQRPRSDCNQLV